MTAPVDICNRALSEIGTRSTIASLDEASPEAYNCSLHYDRLRRMLLRGAHWNFAREQQPALTALATPQQPWQAAYAYPSDCLAFRFLQPPGQYFWAPSPLFRFVVSGKTIQTNLLQAGGVYTSDVQDCDLFDDLFADALTAALAAHVLLALTGNANEKQGFLQAALQSVQVARAADGNEGTPSTDHVPDWILARGDGAFPFTESYGICQLSWTPLAWEGGFGA